jgi:hypothetical protein
VPNRRITVAGSWERYRQVVRDDYLEHRSQSLARAPSRPVDAEVRAATDALTERFTALRPRMSAGGGGDEALYDEVEQLLREHEALRDGPCVPGSHDWEDLQSRGNHLMVFLAYIATAQGRPGQAEEWFTRAATGWQALGDQALPTRRG